MRPGIIFDLDGTLWDATGSAADIWNRVLALQTEPESEHASGLSSEMRHSGNTEENGTCVCAGEFCPESSDRTSFRKKDQKNNTCMRRDQKNITRMTKELAASCMGRTMEEIGEVLFPLASESERRKILRIFEEEEVAWLREHGAILYEGVRETLKLLAEKYDLYIVSNCQDGYVQAFLHAHGLGKYFLDYEMSGRTGCSKAENIRQVMERNRIRQAIYVGDTIQDEIAAADAGIPFIYASYGFGKAAAPMAAISSFSGLSKTLGKGLFPEEPGLSHKQQSYLPVW